MDQHNRTDPMITVFPRITKCTFQKYGPSGTIETHDAICVLALNILNEKIFVFLWFWFIMLAVFSGLTLIYSALIILIPGTREIILKKRFRFGSPAGVSSLTRKTQVRLLNPGLSYSRNYHITDWRFPIPAPAGTKHGFARVRGSTGRAEQSLTTGKQFAICSKCI